MLHVMVFVFVLICTVSYLSICIFFITGWYKMPSLVHGNEQIDYPFISIVIAARNEEQHIIECLQSLLLQEYRKDSMEIIIVDDYSTDATVQLCQTFIAQNNLISIRLLFNREINKEGKKEAIRYGVAQAHGSFILTTDADCKVLPLWAKSMVSYLQENKCKLVFGPVAYYKAKGFFSKFESLDFLSIIVSGAGATALHAPFIANAANMAFEKQTYINLNNALDGKHRASGDDVFLLHKVKRTDKYSIGFLKSKGALVYTYGTNNMREFFSQRLRWAGKSKSYKDFHAQLFSLIVFLFNFSITLCTILLLFNPGFLYYCVSLYILKILIDFPLLYGITKFIGHTRLLRHYIWVQLLYPFYITTAGVLSLLIRNFRWKGRRVS